MSIEGGCLIIKGIDFTERSAIVEIFDKKGTVIFEEEVFDGNVMLPKLIQNEEYALSITVGPIRWVGTFMFTEN